MLNSYSLSNFKAINRLEEFKCHPLTIICGVNSSGKSSFLQSLLLLKQSHKKSDNSKPLVLNGEFVQLGTPVNMIYAHDPTNQLEFNIELDYPDDTEKYINYKYPIPAEDKEYLQSSLSLDLSYSIQDSQVILNDIALCHGDGPLNFRRKESNIYFLDMEYQTEMGLDSEHYVKNVAYKGLLPEFKFLYNVDHYTPSQIVASSTRAKRIITKTREAINTFFDSLCYIGPFREPPSRRYSMAETYDQVGTRGQNAAVIYAQECNKPLGELYVYDAENDNFHKQKMMLQEAVKVWMNLMGFPDLGLDIFEDLVSLSVRNRGHNESRANIADIGFGFSQLFPIIVQGLRMPKSHVLLLEQPEIHLHPGLQMILSDFLISLALTGKQVIVETHSEHIINRLVRRIVEDDSNKLNGISGIHFFSQGPDGINIEEVNVNDVFGITNWPKDFFDQSVEEKELILIKSLKKRRDRRGEIK